MHSNLKVHIAGHVKIFDTNTREVLLDKKNAIHGINMSRMIARALSREPNYYIYRLGLGNGGTFTDVAGNIVFRPPNDGTQGDGYESRLYNETYSEIVDETDPNVGKNPLGGDDVANDPDGQGVVSSEVGNISSVTITMFLNENEPKSQQINSGASSNSNADVFKFDELGLYSFGKPPSATNGVTHVDVGNKTSTDVITNLLTNSNYTLSIEVDGIQLNSTVHTPASGSGPSNALTYGDLCEGLNTGAWISAGNFIHPYAYIYITDGSGGTYPSITNKESFGFLTFQSKTTGTSSTINLFCTSTVGEFFNSLTNGVCGNVNLNKTDGQAAGVANDNADSNNERERLLTHITFNPILKSKDRAFTIEYTLTISVDSASDSTVTINQG